jgi:hypothetical protein
VRALFLRAGDESGVRAGGKKMQIHAGDGQKNAAVCRGV